MPLFSKIRTLTPALSRKAGEGEREAIRLNSSDSISRFVTAGERETMYSSDPLSRLAGEGWGEGKPWRVL